jgi:competence protein ComEC
VISHPNLDHYAGMLSIDDRIAVGRWLLTPHFERLSGPGSPSRYFFDALAERGATVETIAAGDAMDGGDGVRIEVLWPPRSATTDSANDTSLVLRLHHAGRSILLCGDIEEAPQRMLLEQGRLDADVLVLPHHGGVERTTEAFIEAVDPRYLIRSSGMRDHATRNGLIELIRDRTYFNTADDGAITVTIDDHGVTVTPFAQHMRQP